MSCARIVVMVAGQEMRAGWDRDDGGGSDVFWQLDVSKKGDRSDKGTGGRGQEWGRAGSKSPGAVRE